MTYVEGGGGLGKIDFTENDEVIRFELEGGDLRVMPSYTKSALSCAVGEFLAAGSGFIRREIVKVVSEYPSLLNNAHVHALAKDVDLELPQP
ncbi:hypothetical protein I0C86_42645 [Plantactinospora sp. S1510]|uniref:DUF4325 domain-containing protein n=2 Tax=Plantactinospora alkalitolerans TaxID=2789879 RepID=A0ABS0HAQ3_9ACTN|nr:hypothetical protein [Plantactinospora alkalitolerans]